MARQAFTLHGLAVYRENGRYVDEGGRAIQLDKSQRDALKPVDAAAKPVITMATAPTTCRLPRVGANSPALRSTAARAVANST